MLMETFNKNTENPVRYHIDAFDINTQVIETAREGVYSARTLRDDGNCFRYMTVPYLRESENKYHIHDSLKKNINFFVHNLMDELYTEKYDIIFFRNAFIYFLPNKREQVLSNLSHVLKEDGILILGVSETAGVQHIHLVQKHRRLSASSRICGSKPGSPEVQPSFDEVFYFKKETSFPV